MRSVKYRRYSFVLLMHTIFHHSCLSSLLSPLPFFWSKLLVLPTENSFINCYMLQVSHRAFFNIDGRTTEKSRILNSDFTFYDRSTQCSNTPFCQFSVYFKCLLLSRCFLPRGLIYIYVDALKISNLHQ